MPQGGFVHCVDAHSLPTKSVVVYGDRAEVKRVVRCDLQKGITEIIIQNVSSMIERRSLRVDGRCAAVILDVQYQELPLDINSNESDKAIECDNRMSQLVGKKALVDDELNILTTRLEVLHGVSTQISRNISPSIGSANLTNANAQRTPISSDSPAFVLNDGTIKNLTNFLDFYGCMGSDLKGQIRKKTKEAEALSREIGFVEEQLDRLRCGLEYDSVKRNITIRIEAEETAQAEVDICYQVYCASWKPVYDIRVNTINDEHEPNSLKMHYYGVVEQNTGEDWIDTDLVLSTATPSIGGSVPALSTIAAGLWSKSEHQRKLSSRRKPTSALSDEDLGIGSYDYNDLTDAVALQRLAATAAQPNSNSDCSLALNYEQLPCTSFPIVHRTTVRGNGTEHKVSVALLDIEANFLHETAPARIAAAYMTAVATNTSEMPFFPGSASIYLNNSFLSKMELQLVMPNEDFCCSLGIDCSVKVDCKQLGNVHEQIGFVSRSTLETHSQSIVVRNAKATQQVHLTVHEQIPKAVDEKIKVNVLSPDLRSAKEGVCLNQDNNLEWTVLLRPGESRELLVKWSIEYPTHETVTYRQIQRALLT